MFLFVGFFSWLIVLVFEFFHFVFLCFGFFQHGMGGRKWISFGRKQLQPSASRISSSPAMFCHISSEKVTKLEVHIVHIMPSGYALHQNFVDTFPSSTLNGFCVVEITKSIATVRQCNISLWVRVKWHYKVCNSCCRDISVTHLKSYYE